jgi:hypothetical protein
MLNNPIQQIERTQDAYAGNPEGLQQRANMSKELIDLLAMQALQSDLAAQKRNMAMQQQGNPQTIKDQLEEGLMGEYRQKAAEDLGVGPSEGDVVERAGIAGQQMAQNAQMPQGPQGPQGGGGVASQAGPVKLAGGGIVAFDAGGEVTDEYLQEKGMTRAEFDSLPPQQQEQIRRLQRHSGVGAGLSDFLEGLFSLPSGQQGTTRNPRGRRPAPSAGPSAGGITGPSVTPPASGIATTRPDLETQIAEQYKEKGIPNPRDTTLEEQGKLVKDRMAEFEATITPPVAPTGIAAYKADTELRDSAKTELDIDEEKKGLAAIKRIRDLSKTDENEKMLEDMRSRVESTYDETTPSGTARFMDLISTPGGLRTIGRRNAQMNREETARRRELDKDVIGIQTATIELNRQFGADAANAYQKAETDAIRTKQNARTYLATLDKNEREDVRAQMTYDLTAKKYDNDLMSQQERNAISRLNVSSGSIEAQQRTVSTAINANKDRYEDAVTEVKGESRFAALYDGGLDPIDDAAEIEALQGLEATAILARTINIREEANELKAQQVQLSERRDQLSSDLSGSLGTDADAAIAKAGI